MWDALILDGHLATMVPDRPYGALRDGAIGVADGRITWVGPRRDLKGRPETLARSVIEARGGWITPGLVDCHTHLVWGGSRVAEFEARLEGASYLDIARRGGGVLATVRATREATRQELIQAAIGRLDDLLAEGVTVVEVKSGYGLDGDSERKILEVARELATLRPVLIRTTFLGAHAVPPEFTGDADGYIDSICAEILPTIARTHLADAVDAFCESIAFSPAQVRRLFETARGLGLPVKLHAEQLSDSGGAALCASFDGLSADHLEHLSEHGVRAMAAAETVAVLLPGAFYILRETQLPPVDLLRQHQVPIALSTDCNPGTSPVTSLLMMANMGCTLFRLTPSEALAGITRVAAMALGLGASHGTLEVGKCADLVVWDVDQPAELAYAVGANPCRMVIRGGEVVRGEV
jgi:imidazolonepropionase